MEKSVVALCSRKSAQKKALLLHTSGLGVQQIYYTLVDESNDKNNFDATVAILDN